jgi:hypothetical protein
VTIALRVAPRHPGRSCGGERRRIGVEAGNLDETDTQLGGDVAVEKQPPVIG